jgi:hypothetical protein
MNYYVRERHIISGNYFIGGHSYKENPDRVGLKDYEAYEAVSLMYQCKIVDRKAIDVTIGTGLGVMNHAINGDIIWRDLVFPVRCAFNFNLSKHFGAGLAGGFYVMPDYPVLAYHLGPKISYLLK